MHGFGGMVASISHHLPAPAFLERCACSRWRKAGGVESLIEHPAIMISEPFAEMRGRAG